MMQSTTNCPQCGGPVEDVTPDRIGIGDVLNDTYDHEFVLNIRREMDGRACVGWIITTNHGEIHVGTAYVAQRHVLPREVELRRIRAAAGERRKRQQITSARRYAIMRRDGFRCQLCGASASEGARLEIDHKTALAAGGSNADANLWTLCRTCNNGKGAKSLAPRPEQS